MMQHHKQHKYKRYKLSGFTLIEILVALVILAIIGSITIVGLQTAIRSQKIVSQKADRLAAVQSAVIIIERDLEQIINRPILDANGSLLPAVMVRYSGGKILLEFTRAGYINPFAVLNRTTLQRVQYTWDGKSLLRTTWQVLDRVQGSIPQTQILLTGVSSFIVQFMDQNRRMAIPGDTPIITQVMQQNVPLPLGIEFDLVAAGIGSITRIIPIPR